MPAITRAVVRPPGSTFAKGLTSAGKGAPDVSLALSQHASYCEALRLCGVEIVELPPDEDFPDATFVEDVAVIAAGRALLTRPGAPSRRDEVRLVRTIVVTLFSHVAAIAAPGTLDGGDVCEAGDRFYVGISERTNEAGAQQVARWAESFERCTEFVDIRGIDGLLHLKSEIASIEGAFVVGPRLRGHPALAGAPAVYVDEDESYAANCIEVNGRVLVASGFPRITAALRERGHHVLTLDMSEFEKMDGGLSCLSLRF